MKIAYFTVRDVARELNVSKWTVWRWIKAGKIEAIHLPSKHIRISSKELKRVKRNVYLKRIKEVLNVP